MAEGDVFRFGLAGRGELLARGGEIAVALGGPSSGLGGVAAEVVRRIARGSRRQPVYGFVGRRRGLAPALGVAENVFMGNERMRGSGLLQWGVDWEATRREAGELLRELGSSAAPTSPAAGLGEFDRLIVEIARALVREAVLLVLDEPFAELDQGEAARLVAALRVVVERGVAVLVLSERPHAALGYADAVSVVRDGEVVSMRVRGEWAADARGAADAVLRDVLTEMVAGRALVSALEGRASGAVGDAEAAELPLLEVSHWTVRDTVQPERVLVEDVGFAVAPGEIVGLAGFSGSGADALLLSVYGQSEGTKAGGVVAVLGAEVDTATVEKAIAAGLYLVAGDPPRYRLRFIGGLAVPVSASSVPRLAALGLIDRDSDTDPGDGVGGRLLGAVRSFGRSGSGPDQVAGLIREFPASERAVLLLSDPTKGLPEARRHEVRAGIRAVAAAGKGVVLASPDLAELAQLCDRVVVLADGRVTGEWRPASPPPLPGLAALLAPR
ncbi:sugar ABC transporter ATP-binding protein [Herbiconiux moechotypicola]|uniref:Sugar ABC transporter ATP-binding protein n=2 Tax=Herbiconiux moechotypicola TaxID=637393 RepID=A0ABP5QKY4_9MICO